MNKQHQLKVKNLLFSFYKNASLWHKARVADPALGETLFQNVIFFLNLCDKQFKKIQKRKLAQSSVPFPILFNVWKIKIEFFDHSFL